MGLSVRHALLVEIKNLISKDHDNSKKNIFFKILSRHPFLKGIYYLARDSKYSPIWAIVFFITKLLSLKLVQKGNILTFIQKDNEIQTFKQIINSSKRDQISHIKYSLPVNIGNLICFPGKKILEQLNLTKKMLRIFTFLCHKYDFFICLRCSELLAIWVFLERRVSPNDFSAVLNFTDGNPNGLALSLFSGRYKRKLFFISHGRPAPPMYPLRCYCAYLLDQKSNKLYMDSGAKIKQVIYHGIKDQYRNFVTLSDEENKLNVIVLLSKSDDPQYINAITRMIKNHFKPKQVYVKEHPFLSKKKMPPLGQIVKSFDLAIATNTSSILHCLISGVPVLYTDIADAGSYDRYGFVQDGLISDLKYCNSIKKINDFYGRDGILKRVTKLVNFRETEGQTIEKLNNLIFEPYS